VVIALAATLLVVVGLVLEYWHEIKEFWEHVRWPMAAFPWGKLVAISGGILVTLGVAGELFFTYQASRVETKLRENNHRIEVLLNKEAGDAWNAAESAKATAKGFESQIAGANARAAEANRIAEEERLARARIEARVAWRHLTKEQQSAMAEHLKRFSGQWGNIGRVSYDVEITSFATDIAKTLQAAGWHVLPPSAITMRGVPAPAFGNPIEPVITGVTINSTPDSRAREMGDAVSSELHSFGYDATVEPKREPARGKFSIIWVTVEARPEGPQGEYKLQVEREAKAKNAAKTK